ncbi:hypothetical protein ID866_1884 [Astraeus odoratus]|nr:hypothetical protein ID866_1884 [Astraeus odoratus]
MLPHIPHSAPPCPLAPHNVSSTKHSYGTRIRKNSVLKPSARLCQSTPPPISTPRKIKPVPASPQHGQQRTHNEDPSLPVFPLPHVVLHPEDASSKVFQAIGRSFLSVENRAMTIKDLAEMALKFGLMCQNVSAASQAITTYIRNHLSRCEAQQDHPLLLRHALSGTPADDELVSALYSRVGGATNPNKSNPKDGGVTHKKPAQPVNGMQGDRLTNFRRGTMVWYLSKATGVSCPFARAGIRLCEYGKEGKHSPAIMEDDPLASPNRPKRAQAQCGEKRKRLRRSYRHTSEEIAHQSGAERNGPSTACNDPYDEHSSESSDSDKEERPPKVKLTLRLRPSFPAAPASSTPPREVIDLSHESSSSEEGSDDDLDDDVEMRLPSADPSWSLPPYPRRSITLPCYTPTCDAPLHPFLLPPPVEARRSPSVPCSASPPPDSDHDELDPDLDAESDFDWDVSSVCMPSPAVFGETTNMVGDYPGVKQEPQDVRDMLDLWENLDCATTNPSTVSSATVKLPTDDLKIEELEFWEWEFENSWSGAPQASEDLGRTDARIEMVASDCLPAPLSLHNFSPGPGFPVSPCSPFTPSSSSVHSSASPTSDVGMGSFAFRFPSPLSSSSLPTSSYSPPPSASGPPVHVAAADGALVWQDTELLGPDSVHPEEFEEGWADSGREQRDSRFDSMRTSIIFPSRRTPSTTSEGRAHTSARQEKGDVTTAQTDVRPASPSRVATSDVVIVRTCQPCIPGIIATQVEGISVYQTILDSTPLLRRIDTDFVNLSTMLSHLYLPIPSSLPQSCVSISHRLPSVSGVWAPLNVARTYARGLPEAVKDVFLSDELVMRFPTALQEFHEKSATGRMLNQFGPHFNASTISSSLPSSTASSEFDGTRVDKEPVWDAALDVALEEPLAAIPPSFDVALAALRPCIPTEDISNIRETPLSPSEQEMFHTLCVFPDWEAEEIDVVDTGSPTESCSAVLNQEEKPLRRSRRVADAVARTRAAPPRTRGPRHS